MGGWRELLTSIFLVRSERPTPVPLRVWLVIASLSLTVSVAVALQPGQLGDLATVRAWLHYWVTAWDNPYKHFGAVLDYPPLAFLMLWPLSLPSEASVAYWFLPTAIVLTTLAVWAQLRWVSDRLQISLSTGERVALVAMVLSGGGVRTGIWLGQTMALSLLLGALAMQWKRRRPWLAAVCLALCSFKPHIAVGFGLAILLVEGIGIPLAAAAITMLLSWIFAVTIGESLFSVVIDYASNLLALYGGPDRVRGMLSIRFVLDDLVGHYATATVIYRVLAVGSLITIATLAKRRSVDAVTQMHVAVVCMLWSLVFLPHQLYNSVFAAPGLFLLMWPESGLIRRRGVRAAVVAAYVMFGVVDIARLFRLLSRWMPEADWVWWLGYDTSPVQPFALFLLILWRLYERPRANAPAVEPTT